MIRLATAASALCLVLTGCGGKSVETTPLLPPSFKGAAYALPRGEVLLSLAWDGETAFPTATSGGVVNYPDPAARFVLNPRHSWTADDDFKVGIKDGLLTSINVVNDDRLPSIVAKVAEIAIQAALTGGRVGARREAERAPEGPRPGPFSISLLVDPFDQTSIDTAQKAIALASAGTVSLEFLAPASAGTPAATPAAQTQCDSSLCYRIVAPVELRVQGVLGKFFDGYAQRFRALVPDPRIVAGIDIERGICSKVTNTLAFDAGVLTSYQLVEPSELEDCLSIPLDILKAIAAVPGAILGGRTDAANDQAGLLQAQASLLNAQATLVEAQANAQAGAPAAATP